MNYTYQEMPKSMAHPKGMRCIQGDTENIRARILPEDVVYAKKDGISLKMKLVYPDHMQEEKKYPLFFHVQGSAWMKQNLSDHILDFRDIVTNGYILAVVEYRPCTVRPFPAQVEDAKSAMRYIKQHADELHIDLQNIFVSGESSGGHTSLLCWVTWNTGKLDVSDEPLCRVKGFIDLYGISDLTTIETQESAVDHGQPASPDALILGGHIPSQNREKAQEASAVFYIDEESNDTPLLIMHGNKDRLVPFEQSVGLYEKCIEYGKNAEFYCVDGADHGGSMFYCEETIQTILRFLKEHTD